VNRLQFWADFVNEHGIRSVTEIGVWRGEFAEFLLSNCPLIERYVLVDPWRHLDSWNKPFNQENAVFEKVYEEAQRRIAPFASKCEILRGKTTEVELPRVDFTYVDGDHTLRGIAIDLIRAWPKTTWLGGDDYGSIWQHAERFEPSMVFPFAANFAEAVDAPFQVFENQFLIGGEGGFSYTGELGLAGHIRRPLFARVKRILSG
jgi:hypothetical protein